MSKRVSHSLLDPWIAPLVPGLYRAMHIPAWFPPEGIVLIGHLVAIAAAVGFAFSAQFWWGGLLATAGVAGNHLADMVDGTHARHTGQCRNGGELLDHFLDPLSFSYWMIGIAVSCQRLDLALVAVLGIYATAVLTNIRAKLVGSFTLASFGPTEFKTLLAVYGVIMAATSAGLLAIDQPASLARWLLWGLIAIGIPNLVRQLIQSIGQVNSQGPPPDDSQWVISGAKSPESKDEG